MRNPARNQAVQKSIDLTDAGRRLLGDNTLTRRNSSELKRVVQFIADAGIRGELSVSVENKVEVAELTSWAQRKNRRWAKSLGVSFITEEICKDIAFASDSAKTRSGSSSERLPVAHEQALDSIDQLESEVARLHAVIADLKPVAEKYRARVINGKRSGQKGGRGRSL